MLPRNASGCPALHRPASSSRCQLRIIGKDPRHFRTSIRVPGHRSRASQQNYVNSSNPSRVNRKPQRTLQARMPSPAFHPSFPTAFHGHAVRSPAPCQRPAAALLMSTQLDAGVTAAKGFKAAGLTAGFKPSGLPDLALVLPTAPATAAALFTRNLVRAAPVDISASNLNASGGKVAAIVLNSGQANAGTGTAGHADAVATTAAAAQAVGCNPEQVFLCSTGVIGKRFDIGRMQAAIPQVVAAATGSVEAGTSAAGAIMTTDLKLKQVAFREVIGGDMVTVGGMCKGSGMIHPDMATMLAVVTCDADVDLGLWKRMLARAVDRSFHAITVDGDSSTNDVVCALCSGAAGVVVKEGSPEAVGLEGLLTETCIHLAKSIARDGEGATVLLEVRVGGAASDEDARAIAKTIASSSLTKAAVFGRDPNWGRIAAAAGRANAQFDVGALEISIGDHLLMKAGNPVPFDAAAAADYMKTKAEAPPEHYMTEHDTVVINVKVGEGPGSGVAWGCDLSYKYVEINADYTT